MEKEEVQPPIAEEEQPPKKWTGLKATMMKTETKQFPVKKCNSPKLARKPQTTALTTKKLHSQSVAYEAYDLDELRSTYIKNQEKLRNLNKQIQQEYSTSSNPTA